MIYFDNSATTRCADDVVAIMTKCLQEDFGNPSSLHSMGAKGKDYLKDSREIISGIRYLFAKTSSDSSNKKGSDSNNE